MERVNADGGTFERLGTFDNVPVELFEGRKEAEIGFI